jgi:hypothetical protein
MNTNRHLTFYRLAVAASLVAVSACAQAGGGVYWAVNVDAPTQGLGRVSTSVSNTRQGVYVQQPQVVYGQPQVIYAPQPVLVQREPVYVQQPVVYEREEQRRCLPWWAWRERMHDRMHHRLEERMAWAGDRDGGRVMVVPRGDWDGRDDDHRDDRHDDRGDRRGHHGR